MKTILKITIIILALAIVGCRQDDDGNQSTQNLQLVNYSINADEYNISYDDNGKATSIETLSGLTTIIYNTNNQIIQIGDLLYSYNSQGRVSLINSSSGSLEGELIYNSQGQLAVMNITINASNYERNYSYDSQGKLSEIIESEDNIPFAKTIITYDSNNNIVQVQTLYSFDGINFQLNNTRSYTYDNKKNPYKQLAFSLGIDESLSIYYFRLNSVALGDIASFRTNFISNNNKLTSMYVGTSGFTSNSQYTYSYNEANYPVACDINYTTSDGTNYTSYYTWTYETN